MAKGKASGNSGKTKKSSPVSKAQVKGGGRASGGSTENPEQIRNKGSQSTIKKIIAEKKAAGPPKPPSKTTSPKKASAKSVELIKAKSTKIVAKSPPKKVKTSPDR